jgi:SH3 domain-containing YSC84-like protein 1
MAPRPKSLSIAALAATLILASPARAASDPANLVERARVTLDGLKQDREFGSSRDLVKHARAVLIIPTLVKGGLLLGGEGGSGVLLIRTDTGWSYPAFYYLFSASLGLQIGVETSEMVLFIMNDRAVDALIRDGLKLGAQAGIALATLGSLAEAAITTAGGPDVVAWSSSTGAYAGLALNASIIRPRESYNAEYYVGHYPGPPTPSVILKDRSAANPDAEKLRQTLNSLR